MREIKFTKMVASGNDFIVTVLRTNNSGLRNLARKICSRKYGVGADGLLVLEKSKVADIKMRIFNSDGTEASMCGNGARAIAFYSNEKKLDIETKAGNIQSRVKGNNVSIKLTDPTEIKLDIPIRINNHILKVNFVNTGVPHTVIFVEGLDNIDILNIGRLTRYHHRFKPAGTNVDFVELLSGNTIKIRTYERGVEDETLACGTGAVASAIISNIKYPCLTGRQEISKINKNCKINVETKSGEILRVYFDKINDKFKNVWLEGKVRIVYKGEYYV